MAKPRTAIDLANLPPWVVDEIISNLPRAAPESATEAMLMARRAYVPPEDPRPYRERFLNPQTQTPLPHEWDKAEAERFGPGYTWKVQRRLPTSAQRVPNEFGDLPEDAEGMVRIPGRKRRPSPPFKVPNEPIRPYPYDADQARIERRLANARAVLSGRVNPEINNQLPLLFRLPLNDDLLARLAAESPRVVLRKAIQDNPGIVGGLIGAGGVLGGGIAYGLLGED